MDLYTKFYIFLTLTTALTITEKILPKEDVTYRLPKSVRPIQYNIELEPKLTLTNNLTAFNGKVKIDIHSTEFYVDEIVLHSERLKHTKIELVDPVEPDNKFTIKVDDSDEKHNFLKLKLDKPLDIFKTYTLTIEYSGTLWNDMHGFYGSVYKDENKDIYLAATQFEPVHARRAFPCFDEPSFKAKFTISITHDASMNATLSNMDEVSSVIKSDDPNSKVTTFQETDPMSTYLVAFIVSNFAYKENTQNPKRKIRVFARGQAVDQVDYATQICDPLLVNLEQITGMDFPYKTDLVAIPDFAAGAMENWGLITYRETALLYHELHSSKSEKLRVATVIGHELTHMWFGDMITLNWWENTWLNEGFARFFQYFSTAAVVGEEWGLEEAFIPEQLQAILGTDAYGNLDPLTSKVATPSEINSRFNWIGYNKGASVIRMMQHLVGAENFQKGIQAYLKSLKFRNAEPENLFVALNEQITDTSIKDGFYSFFNTFTTQPGYPLVTVRKSSKNTFVVDQEVFLLNNDKHFYHKWTIPLTMTHGMQGNFEITSNVQYLMENEDNKTITLESADLDKTWLILNLQQVGYYRVNYDNDLWQRIIDVLNSDRYETIHTLNRAQLIDDIFNLAKAGLVKYEQVFDLIAYLNQESYLTPWSSAIINLSFLKQRFIANNEHLEPLVTFVRNLVENQYQEFKDFKIDPTKEKANVTMYRAKIVSAACEYENEHCVKQSSELFKEWKKDGSKLIPVDLRGTVYCVGIQNGDKDDWNHLFNEFTKANVAAEQVRIINSLGCSLDKEILTNYLKKTIEVDSEIRSQDASSVFNSVLRTQTGIDVALEFVKTSYEQIKERYGGSKQLGSIISSLGSRLTTEEQIKQYEEFLNDLVKKPEYEDVAVTSRQTIQNARTNLEWNTKYGHTVHQILTDHNKSNNAEMQKINVFMLLTTILVCIYNLF
ncbi:membrane alanyl aminopeptidase-like [Chrysoperla carnea]|uniref:membrane alanyl aminopeptidase-like n=1 Tax=Chrysoperla carnea TaxID=189513 RepID=UPI001D078DBE|nr:membrane alanyl aminopeptidase-like [Chrysoperla carnea]